MERRHVPGGRVPCGRSSTIRLAKRIGDGGYVDANGYVFVVGRLEDMIITDEENMYSAEVENAPAKHLTVAPLAVIGVPDERWGERAHAVIAGQIRRSGRRGGAARSHPRADRRLQGASVGIVRRRPADVGCGQDPQERTRGRCWADNARNVQ
ncbi:MULTISPECIES: hypothetical protein [Nocardia]|uniref:hypothetical protein n=1 Tax=Nocardia TaxID=1817 RepID=UPI000FD6D79C